MLERRLVDERRRVELVGEQRFAVPGIDELDPEQEAPATHLADDLRARQCLLELGAK